MDALTAAEATLILLPAPAADFVAIQRLRVFPYPAASLALIDQLLIIANSAENLSSDQRHALGVPRTTHASSLLVPVAQGRCAALLADDGHAGRLPLLFDAQRVATRWRRAGFRGPFVVLARTRPLTAAETCRLMDGTYLPEGAWKIPRDYPVKVFIQDPADYGPWEKTMVAGGWRPLRDLFGRITEWRATTGLALSSEELAPWRARGESPPPF